MRLFITIFFLQLLLSCGNVNNTKPVQAHIDTVKAKNDKIAADEEFTVNIAALLKDSRAWYNYTYYNVKLSQDFIGLDVDSTSIDKATFLNKLLTGDVIAFKTRLVQGKPVYKLYKFASVDEDIKATSKQLASIEKRNDGIEGQQLPAYTFADLNGATYTPASTKGKILVLKCWFIHCVACVQEFPSCNKLVEENEENKHLLFLSLAIDTKQQLSAFLKTKPFKYAVVPNMEDYMTDKLNIGEYPTHLLVDKTGKIIKVVNTIEELVPFLTKEIAKQ